MSTQSYTAANAQAGAPLCPTLGVAVSGPPNTHTKVERNNAALGASRGLTQQIVTTLRADGRQHKNATRQMESLA